MPLQQYISTGYYIDDCANGLQQPISTQYVYTGYFNQADSDCKAYAFAKELAVNLRILDPCLSPPTTTTTTTSTTTAPPSTVLDPSGPSFDWVNDFVGQDDAYYDIIAWGGTNGYLSGNRFDTDQYFSSLSANDLAGYGVVLAVIKGAGSVTGFGYNGFNQLDIPNGLTDVKQVSVGYDYVLALKNDGTVTGWGLDQFGLLNFNTGLSNVQKVCAGVGGNVFLLSSGIITGSSNTIAYPNYSGFINIDFSHSHILAINSGGQITGIGANYFGESNVYSLNGISKLSAGSSSSAAVYNDGQTTGYGDGFARNFINTSNSGVKIGLRHLLGTVLKTNGDIDQVVNGSSSLIERPDYLKNTIVDISQGMSFTAAIFKRPAVVPEVVITGYDYLWEITYVGGGDSYGGLSIGDLYSSNATVTQPCDSYSFVLPVITSGGQTYTEQNVPNCNIYAGTHQIDFNSVGQYLLLNINYSKDNSSPKVGFAGTGITNSDYWNPIIESDIVENTVNLYYSNSVLSTISGGELAYNLPLMSGISLSHADDMYGTAISGIANPQVNDTWGKLRFRNFPTGNYKAYLYGHGPKSGDYGRFYLFSEYGTSPGVEMNTTSGINFDSGVFTENIQYVTKEFNISSVYDIISVSFRNFINGIQFIRIN